jgi:Phenylacetic acid-responsive transcriptional repressor
MRYEQNRIKRESNMEKKKEMKKFKNAFYYLKRKGLIDVEYRGNQMYFSLTAEGKKKAGKYKINDLKIKAAEKWDKKWRVLIFDIEDKHRAKREALRGKIKELGLYQLQKSVWVCPYEFKKKWNYCAIFLVWNPRI